MKSFKINIPEGFEIDNDKSTFEEIVFKPTKNKYPLSVMELPCKGFYIGEKSEIKSINFSFDKRSMDKNLVSTKRRAEAILALIQLVELRDEYNKIDGFVADWKDSCQNKYAIEFFSDNINIIRYVNTNRVLHFGSKQTCDLFLVTHRKLIETAKELI